MMGRKERILAILMTFAMTVSCLALPNSAYAAKKKKLKVTSSKTVQVGKSIKIKTNVKAEFKSSNKKIATVNQKGIVKGKREGKVKITVISKKDRKQKKIVKITVKKQDDPGKTATTAPSATSTVVSTKTPNATNTPSVSQTPARTNTPVASQTPVVTKTPEVTQTPVITQTPEVTNTPEVTPTPKVTNSPEVTPTPDASQNPSDKVEVGIEAEPIYPGRTIVDLVSKYCFIVNVKYSNGTKEVLSPAYYTCEYTEEKCFFKIQYKDFSTTVYLDATITMAEAKSVEPMPLELFVKYDEDLYVSELGEIPDKSNFIVQVRFEGEDGSWEVVDLNPEDYTIYLTDIEENLEDGREELVFVYTKYFVNNEKEYFIIDSSRNNYFDIK